MKAPIGHRTFDPIVIDLSPVTNVSLDAALVLTAEFHSACLAAGGAEAYRPVIDDQQWRPEVRELFKTLGFYDLVHARERTTQISDPPIGSLRFVPFKSHEQIVGQEADDLLDSLRDAAGQAPGREAAYGALLEAIGNVRGHAYPDDAPRAVGPYFKRWWAAGSYDPAEEVLQFAVYDRGVGIATTLPRQPFYESILRLTAPERTEADIIAGGIRYGRTRHKAAHRAGHPTKPGRGNGLWTICRIVEDLEGSFVRITSGKGEVEFHGRRDVRKKNHAEPLCGTLVEWILKLPPSHPLDAAS